MANTLQYKEKFMEDGAYPRKDEIAKIFSLNGEINGLEPNDHSYEQKARNSINSHVRTSSIVNTVRGGETRELVRPIVNNDFKFQILKNYRQNQYYKGFLQFKPHDI